MIPSMSGAAASDALKLRPRELFFLLVGTTGAAGGAIVWYRVAPMLMQEKGIAMADFTSLGQFILGGAFGPAVLIATMLLLAGGYATRTALGKDRATWIFAAGATVAVAGLLATVYGVGDPLFASPPVEAGEEVNPLK